ncbi:MAG: sigma 54-interacting transcriptional regulator [Myxococcales bacterium]|nr:sigma 54-interacting transcriptional regulator [Myxococcales bacterium]
MATLVVNFSNGSSRAVPLLRALTTIGSNPENDIVVRDSGLESTHAHFERHGNDYVVVGRLRDMTVNGRRERRVRLTDQAVVRFGDVKLTYYVNDQDVPRKDTSPSVNSTSSTHKEVLKAYQHIHTFSQRLAENAPTKQLVTVLLDGIIELTGADRGFLVLFENSQAVVRAARNVNQASLLETMKDQVSNSLLNRMRETKKPLMVTDALDHTEWSASKSVVNLQIRSVLCVPLISLGEVFGGIFAGHPQRHMFDENALNVAIVFAAQAGLLLGQHQRFEELTRQKSALESELAHVRLGSIIGAGNSMKDVLNRVRKVATTDVSVLITGETGTGKELIAREIHSCSQRSNGPFVVINCGAIPEALLESELFGHVRGAFTGATTDRVGRFQAAHCGTLFLDEIGELPLMLQVKLLRALQEKTISPVGADEDQMVDIRIIAATNRNLAEEVKAGRFRDDLYYRLDVVTIELPPLRHRGKDIETLAKYFLTRECTNLKRPVDGLTNNCLATIRKYRWPGNIRELENRIRKAVVMTDSTQLEAEDLGLHPEHVEEVVPLAEAKEQFQREYIQRILERNGGNRTRTAKELGVDPRTIFRHLERLNGSEV